MKVGRKATGGRYKKPKKRKLAGRQSQARTVKLGDRRSKVLRTRGGNVKNTLFQEQSVNIVHAGKGKKVSIKNVLETPSNVFLARQNILVKGAIVETELGKARITNRPSQEGCIQAVIVE